jgi:ATP synthase protein I
MSDSGPPDRLARLGAELDKAAQAQRGAQKPAPRADDPGLQQGAGMGLRIGVELVVAVVVATGLGWAFDQWLGTRPWGTIILFFLGVAAGMVNVYRALTGVQMAVGFRRPDAAKGGNRPKDGWDDED